jgi:2-succinyl-5-enolpyruvyl-6-hydroxy-3-cyclohexene-1-carboxylate synthase
MQKSDPAGTLRLLLSKKQSQAATSSEHTTSDSAPSNVEINSQVRQDSLLLRLATDFTQRDVLKQLEENPACAYSHLAFLKKLHNPLTNEATLGKVNLVQLLTNMLKLCKKGLKMVQGWLLSSKLKPCSMRKRSKIKLRQSNYPPKRLKKIQGLKL